MNKELTNDNAGVSQILELFFKNFKAATIKMLPWVILNTVVTNKRQPWKRNRVYTKQLKGINQAENYNNLNKKLTGQAQY